MLAVQLLHFANLLTIMLVQVQRHLLLVSGKLSYVYCYLTSSQIHMLVWQVNSHSQVCMAAAYQCEISVPAAAMMGFAKVPGCACVHTHDT